MGWRPPYRRAAIEAAEPQSSTLGRLRPYLGATQGEEAECLRELLRQRQ